MQTRWFSKKFEIFAKCLIALAPRAGLPRANNFSGLKCQTSPSAQIDPQRLFPALSNLIVERDDGMFAIGWHDDADGPFESRRFAESVAARIAVAR
jgi:hypothetical protein